MKNNRFEKPAVLSFILFTILSFSLISCLPQANGHGKLVFDITSEMVNSLNVSMSKSSSARTVAELVEAGNVLKIDLNMEGDFTAQKTADFAEGQSIVFDFIPTGSKVTISAVIYSVANGDSSNSENITKFYTGTTGEITVLSGNNDLSIKMKKVVEKTEPESQKDPAEVENPDDNKEKEQETPAEEKDKEKTSEEKETEKESEKEQTSEGKEPEKEQPAEEKDTEKEKETETSTDEKEKTEEVLSKLYKIEYQLNGGSWVEGYEAPVNYTVGKTFTLPNASNVVKAGYTFDGWYLSEDDGVTLLSEKITEISIDLFKVPDDIEKTISEITEELAKDKLNPTGNVVGDIDVGSLISGGTDTGSLISGGLDTGSLLPDGLDPSSLIPGGIDIDIPDDINPEDLIPKQQIVVTLYAKWIPASSEKTDASETPTSEKPAVSGNYVVCHYLQNTDNDLYSESLTERQTLTGVAGENTVAAAKTFEGFTAKAFEQTVIKSDGSTVVNIYYDRNKIGEVEASVSFANETFNDIEVKRNVEGNIITFSVEDVCTSYQWKLDGKLYSEQKTMTIDTSTLAKGKYDISLLVQKEGSYLSYSVQISIVNF